MKSTIKVKILISIILFSIFGCTNKVEKSSKSITKKEINSRIPEKKNSNLSPKKDNDILDSSFIGKNSTEFDKYNLHGCFWSLLHGKSEEDKYCIAQYSKIIEDCRYGKGKIIFGKYTDSLDGKTNIYEIIDELNVMPQDPKRVYYHVLLKLENNEENICLVEFEDNRKEIITKVYRIWKIDFIKEKFVEVKKPKNLTFLNPDYLEE
jgi:hypothetical protein